MQCIKIFTASSEELIEERERLIQIVYSISELFNHLKFEVVEMETDILSVSQDKEHIQNATNNLLEVSQIVVVLFFSKLDKFTLEEYKLALEKKKKVFLYFKKGFAPKNSLQTENYSEVMKFKMELKKDNKTLLNEYETIEQFELSLQKDLLLYINKEFPPNSTYPEFLPASSTETIQLLDREDAPELSSIPNKKFIPMIREERKSPPKNTQKQKERNGGKENNSTLWRLLIGLGALVLVLIPLVYPSLIQFFWPSPDFGVKNAVRKADLPITIIAKNSTAKRKEPLDVRWDNIPFDRGAIPHSDPNIFQWTFSVKDKHLPKKYKKDAEHKLEVGFDGKFSKPITIVFFSQAPIVEAKLQTADDNPRNKILIGKAASKLQDPKEFIRVDVIFFTLGSEFSLPLPVKRITDSEGKIYFQFRTPIEGIPEIPPENPLYDSPFFAFLVTDQAGNRYYHSMSYAQFAAPGSQNFGVNKIADIKVTKQQELKTQEMQIIFTINPLDEAKIEYKGDEALNLKVYAHGRNSNLLEWRNLPGEIRTDFPATIIFRNNQVINIAFKKNRYIDDSAPPDQSVTYQIAQKDKGGTLYKSKLESVSPEPINKNSQNLEGGEMVKRGDPGDDTVKRMIFLDLTYVTRVDGLAEAIKEIKRGISAEFEKKGFEVTDRSDNNDFHLVGEIHINHFIKNSTSYSILIKAKHLAVEAKGKKQISFKTFDNREKTGGVNHSRELLDSFRLSLSDFLSVMEQKGVFNFHEHPIFLKTFMEVPKRGIDVNVTPFFTTPMSEAFSKPVCRSIVSGVRADATYFISMLSGGIDGKADVNEDGLVTDFELFLYLSIQKAKYDSNNNAKVAYGDILRNGEYENGTLIFGDKSKFKTARLRRYEKTAALVIAAYDYSEFRPLKNPIDKIKQLINTLQGQDFDEVIELVNPTYVNLRARFKSFFMNHGIIKDCFLFIFYYGHSYTINKKTYLVPVDATIPTNRVKFLTESISFDFIKAMLNSTEAKHILLVLDIGDYGSIVDSRK